MFKKILLPLILAALPLGAMASTVSIGNSLNGTAHLSKNGIRTDTVTRGRDLAGMLVTASYLDGTTETVTWGATGGPWGEAMGSSFSVIYGWNSFALSVTKSLVSLSMNAITGNAVFDIDPSTQTNVDTHGTKRGSPFRVVGDHAQQGVIDVNYSTRFFVAGHERMEDAYTHMAVDFNGLEGGGLISGLEFNTDLDSLAVAGDFSVVPLPASLLLMTSAFGLLGLGVGRKKRSAR